MDFNINKIDNNTTEQSQSMEYHTHGEYEINKGMIDGTPDVTVDNFPEANQFYEINTQSFDKLNENVYS